LKIIPFLSDAKNEHCSTDLQNKNSSFNNLTPLSCTIKKCTSKVKIFITIKTYRDLQLKRESPVAKTVFET